jgi:hypothetical protein
MWPGSTIEPEYYLRWRRDGGEKVEDAWGCREEQILGALHFGREDGLVVEALEADSQRE